MANAELTIIFWNLWERAQSGRRDDGTKLKQALDRLVDTYDSDIFGLNEVLVDRQTGESPILDHLKSRGYHTHFAPFSPMSDKWMIGSAFVAKHKAHKILDHKLGPDTQADKQRGYPGHHVKAIEAHMKLGGEDVTIVVNYLAALVPLNWLTHVTHRGAYEKVLGAIEHQNIIVGGDFNETKYMLPWLRMPKYLHHRTGSLHNPTWRWDGQRRKVAQANYDHMVWTKQSNLQLKRFEVLPRHPSDHAPLLGIFEVIIGKNNE